MPHYVPPATNNSCLRRDKKLVMFLISNSSPLADLNIPFKSYSQTAYHRQIVLNLYFILMLEVSICK